jgi:adenylate cyclase
VSSPDLANSELLLWSLIDERARPGADIDAIDAQIWATFGEHWTVMSTDLSGFSRHVSEFGIMHFLQVIQEFKRVVRPIIAAYEGSLVKAEADSLLLLFKTPDQAVACAAAMQYACQEASSGRPAEEHILLCVGLGHGPVLRIGNSDVFGAEVNGACKLGEDTAGSHEILVTTAFREAYAGEADYEPIHHAIAGVAPAYRLLYKTTESVAAMLSSNLE